MASISPLRLGTPGSIMEYLKTNGGLQRPNRYSVTITRPNQEPVNFLCSMAQVPSRLIRAFSDYMGVASPLGIPFRSEFQNNLFEFTTEDSWISRKYFEEWQSSMFVDGNNNFSSSIINRANYFDEFAGKITIEAFSIQNSKFPNAIIDMYECFPIEIVPSKFEGAELNTPLKYMVNMFYSRYVYSTRSG